jgi:hypothetical protein
MRRCVPIISAVLLLNACGQAENGVGKAAAQTGSAINTKQAVVYKRPPLPAGFTLLTTGEVTKLIKKRTVITTAPGHIGSSWRFDDEIGKVEVLETGGIVPHQSYGSYRINGDGGICIPANDNQSSYSNCFFLAAKKRNKKIFLLKYISGIGSDGRAWQQIPVFIKSNN